MIKSPTSKYIKNGIVCPDLCYSSRIGIIQQSGWSLKNDLHDEYALIYVVRGKFFYTQQKAAFTLTEGEYVLLDKRINHEYGFERGVDTEIHWICINGRLADSLIAYINSLSPLPYVGKQQEMFECLQTCFVMYTPPNMDPFAYSLNIVQILHIILAEISTAGEEKRSHEEIAFRQSVDAVLRREDLRTLTLDSFCEAMHLTKYYFSHRFKEYYGCAPMKYVNALKLEKAKMLLRCSDLKIGAVARVCGFETPTYFSTYFRRECSITPEAYRAQWQSGDVYFQKQD
jgi:AraC-like DNA-binding protein